MHKFEFRKREAGEHREGHYELMIDGIHGEYTNDPMQHFEKCLRKCKARGMADAEAAVAAKAMAEDLSIYVLDRIADRIKRGSMIPHGIPTGEKKGKFLDSTRIPFTPRQDANSAVIAFLNRGHLDGLDKDDRAKRKRERDARKDDNWMGRRKELIKAREAALAEALKDSGNPKRAREIAYLRDEIRALQAGVLAASHGFQYAFGQYFQAAINFVSDDIRIWPLMTNTTLDTVRDAVDTFSDVTADEFDGANYTTGGLALDAQAVNIDDPNDRAEVDADNEVVTALGAGTRAIQGVALGKFVTNTAASLPLHWLEFATNKTPDGSDFTFQFNAEGILQATG